jgi:hypothetical protein
MLTLTENFKLTRKLCVSARASTLMSFGLGTGLKQEISFVSQTLLVRDEISPYFADICLYF